MVLKLGLCLRGSVPRLACPYSGSECFVPALTVRETLRLSHIVNIPSNIQRLLDRRVSDLSGGERQIVSMFCVLVGRSLLRLLDEPFFGLRRFWT